MKLQKRLSRKYKDKIYYKYIINLPEEDIKKAKFEEGDELISDVREKEIRIKLK